jgi:cobalt-zinc-cadmium resistance protein CzcA
MFSGIEGKTFNQMALNVIIAMLSSIIVAFLLMPILCFYFINKSAHDENKFFTIFVNFYRKILKLSLNNPSKVIITCFIIFVFSLMLFSKLESDFLPDLNEGDLKKKICSPTTILLNGVVVLKTLIMVKNKS